MKKFKLLFVASALVLALANCKKEKDPVVPTSDPVTIADHLSGVYSGYGELYNSDYVRKATFVNIKIEKVNATTIEVKSLNEKFNPFTVYNLRTDSNGDVNIETQALHLYYELETKEITFEILLSDLSLIAFNGNN